jgi:hypothetical protein
MFLKNKTIILVIVCLVSILSLSFFKTVSGEAVVENGVPKCKSPYSEACGNGCSRNVTCGSKGEFRVTECKCNSTSSTAKPATCPVATVWNGSKCAGTAKGTKDETKDQDAVEGGGEKVASKDKKPNDPKTRQEANKATVGGGGSGGGSGSGTGAGGGATATAVVVTGGSCTQANKKACVSGFCCTTGLCSGDSTGSDCSTITATVPNNCTSAEVGQKKCFGSSARICQLRSETSGSNLLQWAETTGIICNVNQVPATSTATCVSGSAAIPEQPGKCLCSASGSIVNAGEACSATNTSDSMSICNANPNAGFSGVPNDTINGQLCNACAHRGNRTSASGKTWVCNDPSRGWEPVGRGGFSAGNQVTSTNQCTGLSLEQIQACIAQLGSQAAGLIPDFGSSENTDNTINQQGGSGATQQNGQESPDSTKGDTPIVVPDTSKDDEPTEIPDDLMFFDLVKKVNAQSLPDVINPSDLKRGVYKLKIPGYKEAQIKIAGEKVKMTYFEDLNADGIKQANEKLLDPKTFEISVSKVSDMSVYELNTGWNLIALDFISQSTATASKLAEAMNLQGVGVVQVSKYDSGNWIHSVFRINEVGNFEKYGTDFNLIPGEGYFVRTETSGFVELEGNHFESSVPINITRGWNLLSVQSKTNYTATTFINRCKAQGAACTTLSTFVNGGYQSVIESENKFFGNDFDLLNTKGYFVLNNSDRKTISP